MTTTTLNATGYRASRDRLARPSLFQAFFGRLVASRQHEAEAIVARYAKQRWCDATERQLNDRLAAHTWPSSNL